MSVERDLEELRQLKARYFRAMDTKDWEGLADVLAADVEVDMTGEGGGVTRSAPEYLSFLRQAIEDVVTVHHGHMPEIKLLSDTRAEGVWAMEDRLWWPEGAPLVRMHGYGHYHETYEKTAGGWKIKTLVLKRLRRDIERRGATV